MTNKGRLNQRQGFRLYGMNLEGLLGQNLGLERSLGERGRGDLEIGYSARVLGQKTQVKGSLGKELGHTKVAVGFLVKKTPKRSSLGFHKRERRLNKTSLGFAKEKRSTKTNVTKISSRTKGWITPDQKTNQIFEQRKLPSIHKQAKLQRNTYKTLLLSTNQTKQSTGERESKRMRRNEEWMANLQ